MGVKLTAAQAREKHNRRLKAATEDMRQGAMRVTEAPGKKAAAKKDKMRQNILAAIDSGKWEQRVASVSLEDWQKRFTEVGVGRVAAGIDAAGEDVEKFFEQLFAHQNKLLSQVDKMPDLTLEDSVQRATAWIRGMADFKRK